VGNCNIDVILLLVDVCEFIINEKPKACMIQFSNHLKEHKFNEELLL